VIVLKQDQGWDWLNLAWDGRFNGYLHYARAEDLFIVINPRFGLAKCSWEIFMAHGFFPFQTKDPRLPAVTQALSQSLFRFCSEYTGLLQLRDSSAWGRSWKYTPLCLLFPYCNPRIYKPVLLPLIESLVSGHYISEMRFYFTTAYRHLLVLRLVSTVKYR
jgi:hypothetical protein